ncbi:MAG: hypothetical protein QOI12_2583 [Alphaproteobacteria bacterium]|nr:hypothetical protein [Alphaproteobacteria bacterium]
MIGLAEHSGCIVISRQKVVGWIMIAVSAAYLAYFLRARVMLPGPLIANKEWLYVISSIGCLMLGTVNVRLAARRERRQKGPGRNGQ